MPNASPFLCFLGSNDDDNSLCLQYWARDSLGEWTVELNDLAQERGLTKQNVTKLLKASCRAYMLAGRCAECNSPAEVTSRTDYNTSKSIFASGRYSKYANTCDECRANTRIVQQRAAETAAKNLSDRIAQALQISEANQSPYDYSSLSYTNTVLLYAALVAANDDWQDRDLASLRSQSSGFTPTADLGAEIYVRLYREGVLSLSASSDSSAIELLDDNRGFNFDPEGVDWVLATDASGLPASMLLGLLEEKIAYPDPAALKELWYLVAVDECKRYFFEQCDRFRLPSATLYTERVAESIRYCIERASIPQVWNIIWCVIGNIVKLTQDRNYTRQHVYNMVSGNIRRDLDRRIANNIPIKPWTRPTHEREAFLTSIIFDKVFAGGTASFNSVNGANVSTYFDAFLGDQFPLEGTEMVEAIDINSDRFLQPMPIQKDNSGN